MEELLNEAKRLAQEYTQVLRDLRVEIKSEVENGEDSAEYQLANYMHLVVDGTQDAVNGLMDALKEKELI